ncbi:MAG: type-F conjugative transfer system secretin TraK [Candidatus Pacearchaeota archaeon]|nr:type-F conjugative transfer system secretin TraK [Candidatus Pacearchaeota archaeon]
MKLKIVKVVAYSALAVFINTASAIQLVDVDESKPMAMSISSTNPTIIRAQGTKIVEITAGQNYAAISEDSNGNAILTPQTLNPFTAFVSLENGQIMNLLLVPKDLPGDTIILKTDAQQASRVLFNEMEYTKAIKYMLFVTATGDEVSGITKKKINKEIKLWKEAKLFHTDTHEADDIEGKRFVLTNVSDKPLVVREEEFHRNGTLGVSIVKHALSPGESTQIFVIERIGARS